MVQFFMVCGLIGGCFMQCASAQTVEALFEFSDQREASRWQVVNDDVMGGRSTSAASLTDGGHLRFVGTLSLENNGGFASVRSPPRPLGLENDDTFVMRIKGDGRQYTFNLYTPDRRPAFSYQQDFQTVEGEWIEVRLPVRQFVAHSFGQKLANVPLDAAQVNSVGVLLGDKQRGGFELMLDFIHVE